MPRHLVIPKASLLWARTCQGWPEQHEGKVQMELSIPSRSFQWLWRIKPVHTPHLQARWRVPSCVCIRARHVSEPTVGQGGPATGWLAKCVNYGVQRKCFCGTVLVCRGHVIAGHRHLAYLVEQRTAEWQNNETETSDLCWCQSQSVSRRRSRCCLTPPNGRFLYRPEI